MRDHMRARGPDGSAAWWSVDGRVGLGHRRLSIIDLSELGAQPMTSADGRFVIVFNGEIYNYRSLRAELEAAGHIFTSGSDTEVLLHLYALDGAAMVNRLRGMYAFAIWDAKCRSIVLARDPLGIKPLYYAHAGGTLRFASQVKALMTCPAISSEPNPAGWAGFFLLGSVPEPHTIYRDVHQVPAGSIVVIDERGPQPPFTFASVAQTFADAEQQSRPMADEDRRAMARAELLDSVRHHLVADVPVGTFLSSGIDSGALVGLMREAGQSKIQTVTLAFEQFRGTPNDEAPIAERIAATYGADHCTRVVTSTELAEGLPLVLDAMDQPSIDGVNTWFVSKAAAELGLKVAISGVGGDELLGGYSYFRSIPNWVKWLGPTASVPQIGRLARRLFQAVGPLLPQIHPKAYGILEYGCDYPGAYMLQRGVVMPWMIDQVMGRGGGAALTSLDALGNLTNTLEPGPKTAFAKIATLEFSFYLRNQLLRDTDWAGMAHSLEVRTPLVDWHLLNKIAPVILPQAGEPANQKYLLANAPSTPLPAEVMARRKTGFSVPMLDWGKVLPEPMGGGRRSLRERYMEGLFAHFAPDFAKSIGSPVSSNRAG